MRTPSSTRSSAYSRKIRIRELLTDQSSLSIQFFAEHFKVSEMTIRRDLDELEQDGQIRRAHGGIVIAERLYFEYDYSQRCRTRREQKIAIVEEALHLIKPGQHIILDSGSTTLELCRRIRHITDSTVITNSMTVASILQASEGIQTFLIGGSLRRGWPDLNGSVAEQMLDLFTVDIVFQGADGIDLDGNIYNENVESARLSKKMHEKSDHRVILADSSKIGKTSLMRFGNLRDGSTLVTDDEIEPHHLEILRNNLKLDVRIAHVGKKGK